MVKKFCRSCGRRIVFKLSEVCVHCGAVISEKDLSPTTELNFNAFLQFKELIFKEGIKTVVRGELFDIETIRWSYSLFGNIGIAKEEKKRINTTEMYIISWGYIIFGLVLIPLIIGIPTLYFGVLNLKEINRVKRLNKPILELRSRIRNVIRIFDEKRYQETNRELRDILEGNGLTQEGEILIMKIIGIGDGFTQQEQIKLSKDSPQIIKIKSNLEELTNLVEIKDSNFNQWQKWYYLQNEAFTKGLISESKFIKQLKIYEAFLTKHVYDI